MTDTTIRLAKRVAEMIPCSRNEAEQYIAGGWISVDGVVIEEAGARVLDEQDVTIHADATLTELAPVTLLLHKPAGHDAGLGDGSPPVAAQLLSAAALSPDDRSGIRPLKKHFSAVELVTPGSAAWQETKRVIREALAGGPRW